MGLSIEKTLPPSLPEKKEITTKSWHSRKVVRILFHLSGGTIIIFIVKKVYNLAKHGFKVNVEAYQKNFSNPAFSKLVQHLKNVPGISHNKIIKRLSKAESYEIDLVINIFQCADWNKNVIKETLNGGYLAVVDKGCFYRNWQKIPNVRKSISSHPSHGSQFRLSGHFVGEVLFGQKIFDVKGKKRLCTVVQFEKYPFTLRHLPMHGYSFLKYWITDENQGPCGTSKFTHRRPLFIPF